MSRKDERYHWIPGMDEKDEFELEKLVINSKTVLLYFAICRGRSPNVA